MMNTPFQRNGYPPLSVYEIKADYRAQMELGVSLHLLDYASIFRIILPLKFYYKLLNYPY